MQTRYETEPTAPVLLPSPQTQKPEQKAVHERATRRNIRGRRIVSKREYALQLGRKAGASAFALLMLFFCLIGALLAVVALCVVVSAKGAGFLGLLVFVGITGGGSLYLGYMGRRTLKEARQIEAGVPLTRANIGDLPAPESFVRASSEPTQALQGVLLRAATDTQEKHQEQLLRAVQEQE